MLDNLAVLCKQGVRGSSPRKTGEAEGPSRDPWAARGSRCRSRKARYLNLTIWRVLLIFDAEDQVDMAHTMTSIWNELQALSPGPRPSSSTPAMWRRWR